MKRTPMKHRSKPRSGGDFTLATKAVIYERDGGRCFCCGTGIPWGEGNAQHRQARGAGGSKYDYRKGLPSNGILVRAACHDFMEKNPVKALECGWRVSQGDDPSTIRALRYDGWVILRIDGTVIQAADVDA